MEDKRISEKESLELIARSTAKYLPEGWKKYL